jgi:uncharacterized membrane-anchored protein
MSPLLTTTPRLNKVPEVTLIFWTIKILSTTVGETAADFLIFNMRIGLTGTTAVMSGLLLVALFLQLRAIKYIPWIYWLTVVLISILGTLITDNLVDNLGVALETTTIAFSVALAMTFAVWFALEKTLSIQTIFRGRRELFYWLAILFTFALGTAAGDLAAESLRLGYLVSALIFGTLIGVATLAYYLFKANAVAVFWIAYILTRPFGASCGDYLSQPIANGGLNLGTTGTSVLFLLAIAGLTAYLSFAEKEHK